MGDLGSDFRWHDTARTWQTPGDGKALVDGMVGASPADRADMVELPDCGHFWMLEQPQRCAQILTEHWRRG